MPQPHPELKKIDFEAWLREKAELDEDVGVSCTTEDCPIATFIRDKKHARTVYVSEGMIDWHTYEHRNVHIPDPPTWARRFINRVDRAYPYGRSVTAREALRYLRERG